MTDTDNDRQPAYVSYPSFEGFLDLVSEKTNTQKSPSIA